MLFERICVTTQKLTMASLKVKKKKLARKKLKILLSILFSSLTFLGFLYMRENTMPLTPGNVKTCCQHLKLT